MKRNTFRAFFDVGCFEKMGTQEVIFAVTVFQKWIFDAFFPNFLFLQVNWGGSQPPELFDSRMVMGMGWGNATVNTPVYFAP